MKQNIKKGRYLFFDGEVYDLGGGDDGQAMAKAEEALTAAQAAQQTADEAQTAADGKAPIYHASENNTYGVGDYLHYGHVKLADTPNASQQAGDGYAATPAAVQAAIDAMGWDLLWTNASPTSNFAAQTIPFDYSDYDFLAIVFANRTDQPQQQTIIFEAISGKGYTSSKNTLISSAAYWQYREGTLTATGLSIAGALECYYGTSFHKPEASNAMLIPLAIYGIKNV